MNLINKLDGWKVHIVSFVVFVYAVVVEGWQNGNWTTALQLMAGSGYVAAWRSVVKKFE